jgi:hypothetical protein
MLALLSSLAIGATSASIAEAQCAKCISNTCSWGPWLSGKDACDDWAPGLGCLASGTCGVSMTHIAPGGGVYERVTTQVVAMNGSTYLHSCSGALVAVRLSPDAADSRSASLAKIVI